MFLPLRLIPVPVQCVVMGTVLDLFFQRDDTLKQHLTALEGRSFRIRVADVGSTIFMGFKRGRVWVHPDHVGDVQVEIESTTAGFSRLLFAREDADELVFQQVLKLSGDSDAMLRFKKLLHATDLDWERELRSAFGDFFGIKVAKAAKALIEAEARVSKTSRQAMQGYFEGMQVPDESRMQAWQAGVEDLTRKLSRIKARVTRLEHRIVERE